MYRQTPFLVVALLGLGLFVWASIATLRPPPYAGFELLANGVVHEVDPRSPAGAAGIHDRDKVVRVDGRPLRMSTWRLFPDHAAGDTVVVQVRRNAELHAVSVVLSVVPRRVSIFNLERLLIGLIFWLVGTIIWMLRPEDSPARMTFLMTQVVAAVLFGEVLDPGVPLMATFTDLVRFFLAPVVLHAFAYFPPPLSPKLRRILLNASYAGAGLSTLLFLTSLQLPYDVQIWRLFEVLILAVALGVLFRPQRGSSLDAQRRRRVLIAGIVAGSAPVVLLTLSSYVLLGRALVPYEWTLPFIALVPIVYSYAAYKGDLGKVDLILNRGIVYLGLTSLLLGLYATVYMVLQSLFEARDLGHAIAGVSLVAFGSLLFVPLMTRLQRAVDRAFYGGWYDYRSFVQSVSVELGRTANLDDLIERLKTAGETMRFNSASLLWPRDELFVPRAAYGYGKQQLIQLRLSRSGALMSHLAEQVGPATSRELFDKIPAEQLTAEERAVLCTAQFTYWLPLSCRDILRSVLVFGQRQGDEALDREDGAILATLSTQAAFACENIQLLESLRQRLSEVERVRDELSETQARLFEGREEERLHLARELHDGPVQDLYALLHAADGLGGAGNGAPGSEELRPMRETVNRVAATLRDICTDLRPPFLSELGLDTAIRSHLARIQEVNPDLDVVLDLKPYTERLSERVELALFRICQEAVNNAVHRGQAARVRVRFEVDAEAILLEVADDGRGFQVPDRWIEFGRRGRLGLLGIAERAVSLGGKLEVSSRLGKGTVLRVTAMRGTETDPLGPGTPFSPSIEVKAYD